MLFSLAQVWLSMSQFMFELEVDLDSVTANSNLCSGSISINIVRECDVYFSVFCLREGRGDSQSTRNEGDCPIGRNTDRMNAYVENEPNMRRITSQRPWLVRVNVQPKVHSSSRYRFTINVMQYLINMTDKISSRHPSQKF